MRRVSHWAGAWVGACCLPLIFVGCASTEGRYRAPEDAVYAPRTVAVVPVAVTFAGRAPRGVDADEIEFREIADSLAFQVGLHEAIVNRVARVQGTALGLQHLETTNERLEAEGISIRDSWSMNSQELAGVLGVDAVVRSEVHRWRYRSNWASFGWELSQEILLDAIDDDEYGDDHDHATAPVRANDVFVDTALIDGRSGEVLWGLQVDTATNWIRRPNGVVRSISRQVARELPLGWAFPTALQQS